MAYRILAAVSCLCLIGATANAQSFTTMPTFGGGSYTTGPNGFSATTMPTFGGGSYTTTNNGFSATTMPALGGSYTTITPPITLNPSYSRIR